ncbi:small GTPase family Rab subfamily protein [Gregarina niphandrodes]|uniref:Small GTPase family Rab subfamily protein n=1 Tax=Gregarina niphandrodes TaxID=110365 RepID=A0A023B9W5_GRENI|nr:small GTPase family Rab subfamily protein [Gregarina niphandrodes]EZG76549.1 small GTPase family Rab subfamily protein [Gregarina niphandrodes]|eukprot:XP_011129565.1 small GTPase family Rab subfamily protein [Gregarina niphandrodes]
MARSGMLCCSGNLLKIVLVGDTGVGKSCLLVRFVDDTFAESYISTIGVDFRFRVIKINDRPTRLQIWDTAGQERFRTITSAYYRGADGVVVMYDCTNRTSFNNVESWVTEVDKQSGGSAIKILVATKSDALERTISTEEGQQKAKSLNMLFAETSAKAPSRVEEPFNILASEIIKQTYAHITSLSTTYGHTLYYF